VTAGARSLIVDDEATLRTVLSAVLSDAGFAVEVCASAEEAHARLDAASYDLMLVDKNLPAENGVDLTRALRARDDDARVLMITGYPSASSLVEAINAGVDGYLIKPFTRVQGLVDEIEQLLQRPRRRTQLARREAMALLAGEATTAAPPRAVIVAADASTRARARHALGAGARDFPSVELGAVAAMDNPGVVAADTLEHLQRLVSRAPRAWAIYLGPAPSIELAPALFAMAPVVIVEPSALPVAPQGGRP
jgi:DNA-binding response OmpR family regulator